MANLELFSYKSLHVKFTLTLLTIVYLFIKATPCQAAPDDFKISYIQANEVSQLKVVLLEDKEQSSFNGLQQVRYNENSINARFFDGSAIIDTVMENGLYLFDIVDSKIDPSLIYISSNKGSKQTTEIPLFISILPPLIAILMALVFKEVIFSLFAGIWLGAFFIMGGQFSNFFNSLFAVVETLAVEALADASHASIIVFSVLIGGMVAIITKNGGMQGFLELLSKYAKSARSTQIITWFTGLVIFFDDYANTLIVGNTLRPLTDKFRISREKLAYIVDSTAAPIASIAFISTWIGYELGEIDSVIKNTEGLRSQISSYQVFLNSLKYAHYPFLTLLFMFILIWKNKDFSKMYKAEIASRKGELIHSNVSDKDSEEKFDTKHGVSPNYLFAIIPIFTLVAIVFGALTFYPGSGNIWTDASLGFFQKIQAVVGDADPYFALLWGSTGGVVVAILLSVIGRKLSLPESSSVLLGGIKSMLTPVVILILAWSLASVTAQLHTATFLTSLIPDGFNPMWLPVITFILAAFISFATGSSWGTMAILFPIALPLAFSQGEIYFGEGNLDAILPIFFNVSSVILAGSVFGDHCSPISDTTILSSLASGCDHIEHVRTQLPYALTVGIISILCGGVLFAIGVSWWIAYIIGIIMIIGVIRYAGKTVDV
ncbi:MAG: Na+/H+ antiporter NhaC family protein [Chitinophagales bacterium]|nr:Na+/H+ antiporter NhaC family protein [Chitinophagales bacterium]